MASQRRLAQIRRPKTLNGFWAGERRRQELGFDSPLPENAFKGFVIDSAATKSFCGLPQWLAFKELGPRATATAVTTPGLWAGGRQLGKYLRTVAAYTLDIVLSGCLEFSFVVHVVHESIPFLLGLDVQTKYGFVIKPGSNEVFLEAFPDFPLPTRRDHLLYIVLNDECFYTVPELTRLHRQFGHASADDIEFVLNRSQRQLMEPEDKDRLKSVVKKCFICQTYAKAPNRHLVSTHINAVFNHEVQVDGLTLDGLPVVLHIVCRGVRLSRAVPLAKETGEEMWNTFVREWINTYTGIPHFLVIVDSLAPRKPQPVPSVP